MWRRNPGTYRQARLLTAAGLALAAGTLVYLTDRVGARSLLLPTVAALADRQWFGVLGGWLPSFFHPFAFSLLTAAVLPPTSAPRYLVCVGWGLVNLLFEVGQHPRLSGPLAAVLPTDIGNYFVRGTFDIGDLMAIGLGSLTAAVFLRLVQPSLETRHEP